MPVPVHVSPPAHTLLVFPLPPGYHAYFRRYFLHSFLALLFLRPSLSPFPVYSFIRIRFSSVLRYTPLSQPLFYSPFPHSVIDSFAPEFPSSSFSSFHPSVFP